MCNNPIQVHPTLAAFDEQTRRQTRTLDSLSFRCNRSSRAAR
ncbi:hypothetical protein [Streptomyces mesophilus]